MPLFHGGGLEVATPVPLITFYQVLMMRMRLLIGSIKQYLLILVLILYLCLSVIYSPEQKINTPKLLNMHSIRQQGQEYYIFYPKIMKIKLCKKVEFKGNLFLISHIICRFIFHIFKSLQ